ncbi:hypothetical protein K6119_10850 [Paracrocinitomix mangrovi]|uniref:hypothetical protein n=1 Tax=Paracrocinitomix mangrovi TaxID=2862509 RepID=UPI001C8D59C0|nr:hypothetical protein [Paracrocinitomix mangrovi]UKN00231.1 hypothetical protein K6119_10850 [Paracrocinitomix mangrovi]
MSKLKFIIILVPLFLFSCRKDETDLTINLVGSYDLQTHYKFNCGCTVDSANIDTVYHNIGSITKASNNSITINGSVTHTFEINSSGEILKESETAWVPIVIGRFFQTDSIEYSTGDNFSGKSWNYHILGKKLQ